MGVRNDSAVTLHALTASNPYLDTILADARVELDADGTMSFPRMYDNPSVFSLRDELVRKYSWAIPSAEAVAAIVERGPVVELGAGTGYWAMMVAAAGGDVIAFDRAPAGVADNHFTGSDRWFDVRVGDESVAADFPERTLLLCWPPYDDPFAYDALSVYRGSTVAYVGEGFGGCTADDRFHGLLEAKFDCVSEVRIPRWYGIHDTLTFWER